MTVKMPNLQQIQPASWFVALYLLTFGIAFPFDISLLILLAGIFFCKSDLHPSGNRALVTATYLFLSVVLVCSLLSHNPQNSFLYSVPLVPALMLFILIRQCGQPIDKQIVLFSLIAALLIQAGQLFIAAGAARSDTQTAADIVSSANSLLLIVPNDIVLFVLVIPFLLCLFQSTTDGRVKALATLIMAMIVLMAIWLQSRTALLTAAVIIMAYSLLAFRNLPWKSLMVGLLAIVITDTIFNFGLLEKIASMNDSRLPLWGAAWSMFLQEPISGFGPHMYGEFYQQYFVADGYSDNVIVDNRHTPWPHNLYLELLAEYGLVGFTAFMALIATAGVTLKRKFQSASGTDRQFLIALTASFAGFLFAGILELSLLRLWVVIYLFLLLSFIAYFKAIPLKRNSAQAIVRGRVRGKNYA